MPTFSKNPAVDTPTTAPASNNKSNSSTGNDFLSVSSKSPLRWPYITAAVLSLIGIADSIYLTIKHLTGQSVQCTISTGCDEVLGSSYATLFHFPLAGFGALAYFTVFSLAILALFGYGFVRPFLVAVVGIMTLTTLRLLYIQAFVLGKYCEFCLLSAAITISLAALMFVTIFESEKRSKPFEEPLDEVWRQSNH